MQHQQIKAVILASGTGTNARAILDYVKSEENQKSDVSWDIVGVVSNKAKAGVHTIAKEFGIKSIVVPEEKKGSPNYRNSKVERLNEYGMKLAKEIKENFSDCKMILCAGFMKVLAPSFLKEFQNETEGIFNIINIHPSLLPSFKGINAYERAYDYGVKITGATTHFVTEELDQGPIILQSAIEVNSSQSYEEFSKKALAREYSLYVNTLKLIQEAKVKVILNEQGKYITEF